MTKTKCLKKSKIQYPNGGPVRGAGIQNQFQNWRIATGWRGQSGTSQDQHRLPTRETSVATKPFAQKTTGGPVTLA